MVLPLSRPSIHSQTVRQLLWPSTHLPSLRDWYRTQSSATTSASRTEATATTAADVATLHLRWENRGANRPDLSRVVALHAASAMATETTRERIQPARPRPEPATDFRLRTEFESAPAPERRRRVQRTLGWRCPSRGRSAYACMPSIQRRRTYREGRVPGIGAEQPLMTGSTSGRSRIAPGAQSGGVPQDLTMRPTPLAHRHRIWVA